MHLTLESLRKSQAVSYALSFFWLDGEAVPAPAQVTQTVGQNLESFSNSNKNGQKKFSGRENMQIDFPELLQTVENYQPMKDWGFTLNAKQEGDPVSWLVYTSQWCKMKIYHRRDFHQQVREDAMHIYYGRAHALNDSLVMERDGQRYHCWLSSVDLELVFNFLDGQTPEEAMQSIIGRPQWLKDYLAATPRTGVAGESQLRYQAAYWDHYGLRFFELLDIRRPDLWDGYINFLKEYAKLKYAEEEADAKRLRNKFTMPEIPLHNLI